MKKRELKQLKNIVKSKLENDSQKSFLSTLLISQEQITHLVGGSSTLINLTEKQLQKARKNLKDRLSKEEIFQLCQLQSEITNLEIKLENLQEEKLEAKIEISPK